MKKGLILLFLFTLLVFPIAIAQPACNTLVNNAVCPGTSGGTIPSYDRCTAQCSSDGKRYYSCYASQNENCVGGLEPCPQEDSLCAQPCNSLVKDYGYCPGKNTYDTCTASCTFDGKRQYNCRASQNSDCVGVIDCPSKDSECASGGSNACTQYETSTICGQSSYNTCTALCSSDGQRIYSCVASQDKNCVGTITCPQEDQDCCYKLATSTTCGQSSYDDCRAACSSDLRRYYVCKATKNPDTCQGVIWCAAENSQCTVKTSAICGDGLCDTTGGETPSNCPDDCGLVNCGGANGCASRGATRCANDIQQTCDNHGRNCLEWGGDTNCNYGCDTTTKKCKIGPGNTCDSGCANYCLSQTIRLFGGRCEYIGPRDWQCRYGGEQCDDFNECTTNGCTPNTCTYTNLPSGTSCGVSTPKKLADSASLASQINNGVMLDDGSIALPFIDATTGSDRFSTPYYVNPTIFFTLIKPDGTTTQTLFEQSPATITTKTGTTQGYMYSAPKIVYSKTDNSFKIVWVIVSSPYDVSAETWYSYAIYAKTIKDGTVGEKKTVVQKDIRLFDTSTSSSLYLLGPNIAHSSQDNKLAITWIEHYQTQKSCCCDENRNSYPCGVIYNWNLLAATTSADGTKTGNEVNLGGHQPYYARSEAYYISNPFLSPPLIAAGEDGTFAVMWQTATYSYDRDRGAYPYYFSGRASLLDTSPKIVKNELFNEDVTSISLPSYGMYNPYAPIYNLFYSSANKKFVISRVAYTGFRATSDRPDYESSFEIRVTELDRNSQATSLPFQSISQTEFTRPSSLKIFETKDADYLVYWIQYWHSFRQGNPALKFIVMGKPPKISNNNPSVTYGPSATISVQTDKTATCKFGPSNQKYEQLPYYFTTTRGTSHSSQLFDLPIKTLLNVRCIDDKANQNPADYSLSIDTIQTLMYCDFNNRYECTTYKSSSTFSKYPSKTPQGPFTQGRAASATPVVKSDFNYEIYDNLAQMNVVDFTKGTVQFWMNIPSIDAQKHLIFRIGSSSATDPRSGIFVVKENNRLYFGAGNSNTEPTISADIQGWTAGSWHNIAFSWAQNGKLKAFIDGVPIGQIDYLYPNNPSDASLGSTIMVGSPLGSYLASSASYDDLKISGYTKEDSQLQIEGTGEPVISNGLPRGTIISTSLVLTVRTDILSECRYSTSPGRSYDEMSAMSLGPATGHSTNLDLSDGDYAYYVKCAEEHFSNNCVRYTTDGDGNQICVEYEKVYGVKNSQDYTIAFSINSTPVPTRKIDFLITQYPTTSQVAFSPKQEKIAAIYSDSYGVNGYPQYYYSIATRQISVSYVNGTSEGVHQIPEYGSLLMSPTDTWIIFPKTISGVTSTYYSNYSPTLVCNSGRCGFKCPAGSTFSDSCTQIPLNTCNQGKFCTSDGCALNSEDTDRDSFDNPCDQFPTDPCSVAIELDNCNNNLGASCPACVRGTVSSINGEKLPNILVQIIGQNKVTHTLEDGSYLLAPVYPGTHSMSAAKTREQGTNKLTGSIIENNNYSASILPNVQIYPDRITVVDFVLGYGESKCESDCTYTSDSVCHSSCQGTNGCKFYDSLAMSTCDEQTKDFRFSYDPGQEIQCCTGSPYAPVKVKAVTEINSSNVVRIIKLAMYEGKIVKIIIDIFD